MKYISYALIVFALGLLSYFVFFNEKPQQREFPNWETKVNSEPPITVKVTPVELGRDAGTWKFDIVLDTHSGSLDVDLLQSVLLADDKGNMYKPTSWQGPGPGGHHSEGILIFDEIKPTPSYVELKIKNVGGVAERSFKWNIE